MDRLAVDGLPECGAFVVGHGIEERFAEGGVRVEGGVGKVGEVMTGAVAGGVVTVMVVPMGRFVVFCGRRGVV